MTADPTILTKSDFLEARDCPSSYWLTRRRPEKFPRRTPGPYDLMLMEEGKVAHSRARRWLAEVRHGSELRFEEAFESGCGLHARADAVEHRHDGAIDIIEIKASTKPEDHIIDIAFQKVVAQRCGHDVADCLIAHLNPEYRVGITDETSLFVLRDVTSEVGEIEKRIGEEADAILMLLASERIEEAGCECRYRGSIARRCSAFNHLNRDLGVRTAHLLPNISASRLRKLDGEGRLSLDRMTFDDVTNNQAPHLEALQTRQPVIDHDKLASFLDGLTWPLHFYDYETHARAVPIARGHGPYIQVPVQFSLHILDRAGGLTHHEHLSHAEGEEAKLVASLAAAAGSPGSFIAWNMAFEKGRNRALGDLLPEARPFLDDISERTVDLMLPFKNSYVHPAFAGSASIKKVLPVICPHLSYSEDGVHDGAGAMAAWREMVESEDGDRGASLRKQLLEYCELDTFAMVEILRFLERQMKRP